MAKIRTMTSPNACTKVCAATGTLSQCHFEDSLAVPYKTKYALVTYNLAIKLPGIHPNKLKVYVHTKPCM